MVALGVWEFLMGEVPLYSQPLLHSYCGTGTYSTRLLYIIQLNIYRAGYFPRRKYTKIFSSKMF